MWLRLSAPSVVLPALPGQSFHYNFLFARAVVIIFQFHKSTIAVIGFSGKGADPKSAVGTAFSFSRPKRQATLIANVSRLLQFASKRFVNSFLTK